MARIGGCMSDMNYSNRDRNIEMLLIAPCGMNCGVCRAYLRRRNKCPGCRGSDAGKPVTRLECGIKTCEVFQKTKSKFCFQCEEFPCETLGHLDKRYRTRYSMSMIENLESIKKSGIQKFIRNDRVRWTCPECGGVICVHTRRCIICGAVKNNEG